MIRHYGEGKIPNQLTGDAIRTQKHITFTDNDDIYSTLADGRVMNKTPWAILSN